MDLKMYYGKRVKILADNGKEYRGYVTDYIYPEDNEPEGESILLEDDSLDCPTDFRAEEIKSIELTN